MATAFAAAAAAAIEDPSVRVVVLDAEGSAFCVGGDLRAFADSDDRGTLVAEIAGGTHRGILALVGASLPVVSVVHGTIAGGGIGVALRADIVLMASDAVLKSAYTAVGLSPDCGATWFLTARAGAGDRTRPHTYQPLDVGRRCRTVWPRKPGCSRRSASSGGRRGDRRVARRIAGNG